MGYKAELESQLKKARNRFYSKEDLEMASQFVTEVIRNKLSSSTEELLDPLFLGGTKSYDLGVVRVRQGTPRSYLLLLLLLCQERSGGNSGGQAPPGDVVPVEEE